MLPFHFPLVITLMSRTATLAGILAIVLWSMSVALTRSLAETLGPMGAGASIYTLSGLFVWLVSGNPKIRQQHPLYLWGAGALFVIYMVAFALAIGLASTRPQTLEISLINYLWPSLTLLFAIKLQRLHVRWWLWLGVALAFSGVIWVVGGGNGLSFAGFAHNVLGNPISYSLAALAAIAWALYSNLVKIYCPNKGALPLFLLVTAACLWLMFLFLAPEKIAFTRTSLLELCLMSGSTALAYLCWDHAMKKGNATLVAALSYFTPLLSIIISSVWLHTTPSEAFWPGVALVITGSLLCWSASRR